jgi:pyrophosphatase PpaX
VKNGRTVDGNFAGRADQAWLPSPTYAMLETVSDHVPVSHVLFDLDGTLIDTVELILTCYRQTFESHRGAVPPDEAWLAGMGTPLRAQFRGFTDDPAELEAMVKTYGELNRNQHDALIREFPGVFNSVQALADRHLGMGIVSSKLRAGCLRGLARCRLDGFFRIIVAADDVQRHKPDPAPVYRALELLGADPAHTIFVGDSPHDLVAGRAAGVQTAAALWGPFPRRALEDERPDYLLSHPKELISL